MEKVKAETVIQYEHRKVYNIHDKIFFKNSPIILYSKLCHLVNNILTVHLKSVIITMTELEL